ncbi:hypothetical protein [Lysinibacillus endophyticus]|uniref:hypothetical protein n=1 Tax=Ureibacillus endophyticus TaxID=1978490 RepID=UPI003135E5B9
MRAKVFIMVLLIVLFLVGCDSEEEVDRKVQDYIKETYGFEVDITYRESLNEGNMGDRIYQVQRTDINVRIKVYIFDCLSMYTFVRNAFLYTCL